MKNRIVIQFIQFTVCAAIGIIILWMILSYILLYSGKSVNQNAPEYLVNAFEQYVQIKNKKVTISKEGKRILEEEKLWLQVLNKNGKVVYECNTPNQALEEYSAYQIVYYSANSDTMKGYTIFSGAMDCYKGYGILLGCDSDRISKMSLKINGDRKSLVVKELILFFLVASILLSFSGYLFSKRIGRPISYIIKGIAEVAKGEYKTIRKPNDMGMYKTVFHELEKLSSKLKEREKEREKLEKMRAEWIASISHDLKTPLSSIKGYSELLSIEEYAFSDEEKQQFFDIIENSVDYMEELIEELRISQKLKEGTYPLKLDSIDLVELMNECMEEVLGVSQFNQRKIYLEIQDKTMLHVCDRGLMKRCIMNLLINAFVHNNEHVEVKIKLCKEDRLHIIISDNGKGIKSKNLPYVFERYFRGGNTEKVEGSGLGLAIVKNIVVAHQGTIDVKSILDIGTEFYIKL